MGFVVLKLKISLWKLQKKNCKKEKYLTFKKIIFYFFPQRFAICSIWVIILQQCYFFLLLFFVLYICGISPTYHHFELFNYKKRKTTFIQTTISYSSWNWINFKMQLLKYFLLASWSRSIRRSWKMKSFYYTYVIPYIEFLNEIIMESFLVSLFNGWMTLDLWQKYFIIFFFCFIQSRSFCLHSNCTKQFKRNE